VDFTPRKHPRMERRLAALQAENQRLVEEAANRPAAEGMREVQARLARDTSSPGAWPNNA